MLAILDEYKLIKFVDVNITSGEEQYVIKSVGVIDKEALEQLSDEQILTLVKNGVYKIIDMHFVSLANIDSLAKKIKK